MSLIRQVPRFTVLAAYPSPRHLSCGLLASRTIVCIITHIYPAEKVGDNYWWGVDPGNGIASNSKLRQVVWRGGNWTESFVPATKNLISSQLTP
jgi:hypothetical protein